MKNLLAFLLFTTLSIGLFSCSKNEEQPKDKTEIDVEKVWAEDECIALIYPISISFPDGSTNDVPSSEDYDSVVKAWYEAHPDSKEKPSLNYPVDVIFGDKVITVDDEKALIKLKEACDDEYGDDKKDICIELIYPASYTFPNGETTAFNSDEEYIKAAKEWYETHPDAKEMPALNYPVDVIFKDEIITIDGEEAMIKLKKACAEGYGDDKKDGCIKVKYPASFTFPDGETMSFDSDEEYINAAKEWYETHPDAKEMPALNYPVDVYFDDKTLTVNNEEEMIKLKKACSEGKYDCPELKADIGEECKKDDDSSGTVTEDCNCI